jgi:hypothetical protein
MELRQKQRSAEQVFGRSPWYASVAKTIERKVNASNRLMLRWRQAAAKKESRAHAMEGWARPPSIQSISSQIDATYSH